MNTKKCRTCGTENALNASNCKLCRGTNFETPLILKRGIRPPFLQRALPRIPKIFWIILAICVFILIFVTAIHNFPRTPPLPSPTPHLPSALGEVTVSANQHEQMIGINDGSFAPFDLGRSAEELTFKKNACDALRQGQGQKALSLWRQALSIDSRDAEVSIYIENQRIRESGQNFVTFVAGIGFDVSFAGSVNQSDQEMLQGIYTAQHEYNLHNNLKVRVLIANAGSQGSSVPLIAQQIVQIAKQEKIVAVLGWLTSASTLQALPILAKSGIPLISPEATGDELSSISPYFFRVVPPNSSQAKAGAKFAEETLHVHNIVVFSDPTDSYSQNLAQDFIKQFADDHYRVTSHIENFMTSKTGNFSQLIKDALKYHPDLLYFTSPRTSDSGAFEDVLPPKVSYANLSVLSGDAGYAIHPNAYGRWFFTALAFPDEWIGLSAPPPNFFQEYRENFDPTNMNSKVYDYGRAREEAILSYDAASISLQALLNVEASKQDTPSPQDIANALSQIKGRNAFQGVSGQISFGDDHDPTDKAVLILYASEAGFTQGYAPIGCFLTKCSR